MEPFSNIEIRVVSNGYWVRPIDYGRHDLSMDSESVRVFETFEHLTAWLMRNMKVFK